MTLQEAYYESKFEIAYLRSDADAFQSFFEELMGRAHKTDFMACRPWGNIGDKKNDGFLKSEKQLFQVYAPNEMTATAAKAKIEEDFAGALEHWRTLFEKWAFVHNADKGLPPHVHQLILELERDNDGVKLEVWGKEKLREIFWTLPLSDKESWFGVAPAPEQGVIGFEPIRKVLSLLSGRDARSDAPAKPVPPGKIEANALSECTSIMITAGMARASEVEHFFASWNDPNYGESMCEAFRVKYAELRDSKKNLIPDEIFSELQTWAGGNKVSDTKHQTAVLAVLAYFFSTCDIFEAPRATPQ
jgi:hypothetical protein